jgi:hypothetical protein
MIFFIFNNNKDNMLYINKGQENTLVLNINNNSRDTFTGYTLNFVHIMSKESKSYTVSTSNPAEYAQNIRYCEIVLPLDTDDLNYLGQYELNIFGDTTTNVFKGIAILQGVQESHPFTQYISPNEVNENYIYIQD